MSLSKAAPAVSRTHADEWLEQLCEVARRIARRSKFPSVMTCNGHLIQPRAVLQMALSFSGVVPEALAVAANDRSQTTVGRLARRLIEEADAFNLWPAEPPSPRAPLATGEGVGPMTEHPSSYGWSDQQGAKERQQKAAQLALQRKALPDIRGSQLLCLSTLARRIRADEPLPDVVTAEGVEKTVPDFLAGIKDSLPCPAPIAQGFDVIGSATTAIVARTMLAVAKQKGLVA